MHVCIFGVRVCATARGCVTASDALRKVLRKSTLGAVAGLSKHGGSERVEEEVEGVLGKAKELRYLNTAAAQHITSLHHTRLAAVASASMYMCACVCHADCGAV